MFLLFLPTKNYLTEVVVVQTNSKIEGKALEWGEFLRRLGLWLLMSTTKGFARSEFWSNKEYDPFEGPPFRFQEFMSKRHFDSILSALSYSNATPPAFKSLTPFTM
jgi:Transposase IS4